jgi:methylthioribulose-1-phosphate dehydratase
MNTKDPAFVAAAGAIREVGRRLAARGFCPATSGNLSQRAGDAVAITVSGTDKGALDASDIMLVDLEGRPLSPGKPSAETLLHTRLYRRPSAPGAVLHTHALSAALLSRLVPEDEVVLEGWELLKAFEGIETHEAHLTVPILDNTQDIARLTADADRRLDARGDSPCFGYLIRGHGLYAWGRTMADAFRHLEAFDSLLSLELHRRRLVGGLEANR